jgi:TonB-linked SusC/RagA family outer membrane protein
MHDSYINKKYKSITILVLTFIFSCNFYGQEIRDSLINPVKGRVIDEYGNAVNGVVLQTIDKDSVAATSMDGNFAFSLVENKVIYFYHPQFYVEKYSFTPDDLTKDAIITVRERHLKNPEKIDVLFDKQEKSHFLGAESSVYTPQLTTTLQQTYVHALPGRLAGLYTQQYRGLRDPQTQANTDFNVYTGAGIPLPGQRSITSDNSQFSLMLRGQNPVVVIDGVQRDLSSIDPQNIESISVQKDALSSILLGMRSSRGMLLVTTKEPNQQGFRLNFTSEVGFQQSLSMPNPLDAASYAYLLNEGLQRNGREPIYTEADYQKFKDGSSPYTHPNVNWYDTALKKSAPLSIYNLNVNGGNKSARYFLSLGYYTQDGFFKSSGNNDYETNQTLDRYLVTTKIDVDVTDDFKVGLSLFGRIEDGNQPGATTGTLLQTIYTTPNSAYPVRNPNGTYGGSRPFQRNIWEMATNSGYLQDNKKDVLATVNLDYNFNKFVKGLSFKGISSISVQNRTAVSRVKRSVVYDYTLNDSGAEAYSVYGSINPQTNNFISVGNSRYWFGQAALNYKRSVGSHNFEAKALADSYSVTTNYELPNTPADIAGTVKYNFKEKYFAEAAINRSYYNGYRPGQQWGTFYAFGVGYDIAKEDFLKDVSWLDQFKLRAVYGKTGNGIDNAGYYNWRQTFSTTSQFDGNTYPQGYSNSTGVAVVENAPLFNPNVTWEKGNKLDIGADITLLNNHLNITADYYYDKYSDLLQTRGKSIELLGFSYPAENIGKNLYYGGELAITYQNNIGDFNYYITGNWSLQASKREFFDEQFKPNEYNKVSGQPVNAIFGYVADGFFQSREEIENSASINNNTIQPGDLKYKDLNGDGIINDFDVTAIGNTKPLGFYGIEGGLNYKGFDFNVLVQGVYNRDIVYNNDVMQAGFINQNQSYGQAYTLALDRWTPENPNGSVPGLRPGIDVFFNPSPNFQNSSSYFVHNGDYVRLKNMTIGYTIPKVITGIQLRVYAQGLNLITWSPFRYGDPEVTTFTSYPNQRIFSAGLNIKF